MLIQFWIMYGPSVHTNLVGDDWMLLTPAATTPLSSQLLPGIGYHYNPITEVVVWVMFQFFGFHHVAAYHLFAYFLFWLTAVLIMLIARKLTGSSIAGALAGILFIGFGTQYEAAIWGVVAYWAALSTAVYAAGFLCFILAHDTWRARWQRILLYSGFVLAVATGPFIYEQDITLVVACLLYRVLVVDQDIWRDLRHAPRTLFSRIPAYLADFAAPVLFFVGYLAFKVILGRMYPGVPETPGLSDPLAALAYVATLGVFQAFVPGVTLNGLYQLTQVATHPHFYFVVLAIILLVMLVAFFAIKPAYKFLLLWAILLICTQTLGLGNIASRHLLLMTVPTAIIWAGGLTALPGLLSHLSKRLSVDATFAWQAGYGASVLLLLVFLGLGYRYSMQVQGAWRGAVGQVDAVVAELKAYAAANPEAQHIYMVNLPDYTFAPSGDVVYEFRNSEDAIVKFDMPNRFSTVVGVRTTPEIVVDGDVLATNAQIDTWASSPSNLVLVYDPSSGQLERWQPPRPLVVYYNAHTHDHWVTTSTAPLTDGYVRQKTLAYLTTVEEPETYPIFGCVTAAGDHFLSLQGNCEGSTFLLQEGWLYNSAQAYTPVVGLYRCRTTSDHFISTQPTCDGGEMEAWLGFGGSER